MSLAEKNAKQPSAVAQMIKNSFSKDDWPKEGAVVEAALIKKTPRAAYFDLGRFGTGVVFGVEAANAKDILKNLKPGEKTHAKIVSLSGEGDNIELSLAEASRQQVWQEVKDLAESGEVIKAKVIGANAGGLMATFGNLDVKAFMPVSQLSVEHYPRVPDGDRQKIVEELRKFVGQEMSVKILDVNPRSSKLIISEREVLSENVKEQLGQYSVGQEVEGVVTGIADFGVFIRFVDNPQIEGMIHISELSHKLVDNPKELVEVGQQVKVKISDIKEGKVFLSLKALEEDPWQSAGEAYREGQEVAGTVYKMNPVGAVISLEGGLQGLVHIAEFGGQEEMKAAIGDSQPHKFIVDSVKPEEKRIILKLKK